jgi:hypothetical protein
MQSPGSNLPTAPSELTGGYHPKVHARALLWTELEEKYGWVEDNPLSWTDQVCFPEGWPKSCDIRGPGIF